MLNPNEKRPERVLQKGEFQEVACPSCGTTNQVASNATSTTCKCGQVINWGLRKA